MKFEVRLPEDKLVNMRNKICTFKRERSATLQELQSLICLLNFAYAVVPPGRTFLRRIIDLTIGFSKSYHHRRLKRESQADLQPWSIFLENFNGRALFHSGITHTSQSPHLFTDASNSGCRGQWFYGPIGASWLNFHISVREFLPIVLAIEMWGPTVTNTSKNTSKDPNLMSLMRQLMITSLRYNIHFRAEHIPGLLNTHANLLSRLQIQHKDQYPKMDRKPTVVPPNLLHL